MSGNATRLERKLIVKVLKTNVTKYGSEVLSLIKDIVQEYKNGSSGNPPPVHYSGLGDEELWNAVSKKTKHANPVKQKDQNRIRDQLAANHPVSDAQRVSKLIKGGDKLYRRAKAAADRGAYEVARPYLEQLCEKEALLMVSNNETLKAIQSLGNLLEWLQKDLQKLESALENGNNLNLTARQRNLLSNVETIDQILKTIT